MKTKKILVILMALATVVSACTPAETPVAIQPTSIPTSTVPAPTATANQAVVAEFPALGSADIAGDEQAPGQYRTPDWYGRPFTFETNMEYRGIGEHLPSGALFGLAQGQASLPPKQILFWLTSPSTTTEKATSMLLETESLEFGPTETVELLGISATQFDGKTNTRAIIPAIATFVGHVGGAWSANSNGVQIRFIVLDVSGQTMVIYIEAPQAEFEDFIVKASQVLDTVQFTDASPTP